MKSFLLFSSPVVEALAHTAMELASPALSALPREALHPAHAPQGELIVTIDRSISTRVEITTVFWKVLTHVLSFARCSDLAFAACSTSPPPGAP